MPSSALLNAAGAKRNIKMNPLSIPEKIVQILMITEIYKSNWI